MVPDSSSSTPSPASTGPVLAVKICGVCSPADAAFAVEAGASHVGVIRVPGSRRTQPPDVARATVAAAEGARRVGVFVDAAVDVVLAERDAIGFEVVQLHGSEPLDTVRALREAGLEAWKVVKPQAGADVMAAVQRYPDADLILLEGKSAEGHGGVGARFPWDAVEAALRALPDDVRYGVGGGLNPDNVAQAVRRFRPALVDVSSGVEAAVCEKDPDAVRRFIRRARDAA